MSPHDCLRAISEGFFYPGKNEQRRRKSVLVFISCIEMTQLIFMHQHKSRLQQLPHTPVSFFFVNSRRTPVINAVKPHEEELLQRGDKKNQDEMIRPATFRHSNVQLSHSTFGDRQEEETHVNAHSYTFTHVNTFITSLIKQTPLSHTAFQRGLWTHTCSNRYWFKHTHHERIWLITHIASE